MCFCNEKKNSVINELRKVVDYQLVFGKTTTELEFRAGQDPDGIITILSILPPNETDLANVIEKPKKIGLIKTKPVYAYKYKDVADALSDFNYDTTEKGRTISVPHLKKSFLPQNEKVKFYSAVRRIEKTATGEIVPATTGISGLEVGEEPEYEFDKMSGAEINKEIRDVLDKAIPYIVNASRGEVPRKFLEAAPREVLKDYLYSLLQFGKGGPQPEEREKEEEKAEKTLAEIFHTIKETNGQTVTKREASFKRFTNIFNKLTLQQYQEKLAKKGIEKSDEEIEQELKSKNLWIKGKGGPEKSRMAERIRNSLKDYFKQNRDELNKLYQLFKVERLTIPKGKPGLHGITKVKR